MTYMKRYIYPKFSDIDLDFIRFGGPGLANLLFIYARAVVLAEHENAEVIWPTWKSIKIGPWLRHESDKRFYGDLFINDNSYVHGLRKVFLRLCTRYRITAIEESLPVDWKGVASYSAFQASFEDILEERLMIRERIFNILTPKCKEALCCDFQYSINVHIRLGDFASAPVADCSANVVNTRLPIEWYVKAIADIQNVLGNSVSFNIFSDGTDHELAPVLSLPNVHRVFYGNAMADMLALSQSKVIIASASSFSLWARFLGGSSCILFKNQLTEHLCTDPCGFEYDYGLEDKLSDDIVQKLKCMYS